MKRFRYFCFTALFLSIILLNSNCGNALISAINSGKGFGENLYISPDWGRQGKSYQMSMRFPDEYIGKYNNETDYIQINKIDFGAGINVTYFDLDVDNFIINTKITIIAFAEPGKRDVSVELEANRSEIIRGYANFYVLETRTVNVE